MEYILLFLNGMITFISPCLLPLLPVYLSYFAGQDPSQKKGRTMVNAIGFVLGFMPLFMILGVFSGSLGGLFLKYQSMVNLFCGLVVILFGLHFAGWLNLPFLAKVRQVGGSNKRETGFFSSMLFGLTFAISWTPCVGTFLGTAMMLAASSGSSLTGMIMLFCYSLGLGIPFLLSAFLMDQFKNTFDFIKRNYGVINRISGIFLILIGIMMATGILGRFLALLTF